MSADSDSDRDSDRDSDADTDELSRWPPRSQVCVISDSLLAEVLGLSQDPHQHQHALPDQLRATTSLDLHLRDGSKGKICRVQGLTRLVALQQLNLSYNALHKLEGLEALKQLRELNLAENCISRIEGIFHLTRLERLNLSGNVIERVPSSVSALVSLHSLRLNRNKLSDLRDLDHLRPLPALRNLRIDGNDFPVPPGATGPPALALRRYVLQKVLPKLEVLDNEEVTEAERSQLQIPMHLRRPQADSSSDSDSDSDDNDDRIEDDSNNRKVSAHSHKLAALPANVDVSLLQQRLVAEQRRAELLEEEAQQARKHFQQLTSSPGIKKAKSPSQEEELMGRLHSEKSNEAMEARALVNQLKQELTFKQIDNTFEEWGANSQQSETSSCSSDSSSSSKHFQNIYSNTSLLRTAVASKHSGSSPGGVAASSDFSAIPQRSFTSLSTSKLTPQRLSSIEEGEKVLHDLQSRLQILTSKLTQADRDKSNLQDSLTACTSRLHKAERDVRLSDSHVQELEKESKLDKMKLQKLEQEVLKLKSTVGGNSTRNGGNDCIPQQMKEDEYLQLQEMDLMKEEVLRSRKSSAERDAEMSALQKQLSDLKLQLELKSDVPDIPSNTFTSSGGQTSGVKTILYGEHEMEVQLLRKTIEDLQGQLEEAQRDGSESRDNWIKARRENNALRSSLQEQLQCGDDELATASMLDELKSRLASKESHIQQMEAEATRLEAALEASRAELEVCLNQHRRGSRSMGPSSVHLDDEPVAGSSTKYMNQQTAITHRELSKKSKNHENYFDETESSIDMSSDQDISGFDIDGLDATKQNVGQSKIYKGIRILTSAHGLSGHETTAAHTLAAAILEELKAAFDAASVTPENVPVPQLKRACVNAALRLICSAGNTMRNHNPKGGEESAENAAANAVLPLAVFGEGKVIAKLVSDGQVALDLLEDTKHLRLEKLQVERVLDDMNKQMKQLDQDRKHKEGAIDMLSKQCNDTKRHAQATLLDLDTVLEKLKDGRKSVLAQERQIALRKKEIEAANIEFEEINKLSQMEHKNIDAVRLRLKALHKEKADCETCLAEVRQKFSVEESRFRNAKSVGTTEIRGLHEELVRMQSQLKLRQKEIQDSRKSFELLELKQDQLQKEAHEQHIRKLREVDEGSRMLANLEGEMRAGRLEIVKLEKKKKQVGDEVTTIEEKVLALRKQAESDEKDVQKVMRSQEKHLQSLEKAIRGAKDKVTEMEGEKNMLAIVIDDLKRQQSEAEKSFESRKRELEEELSALQGSLATTSRSVRLSAMASEQQRGEAETLQSEIRSWERKLEDLRRMYREQELTQDSQKEILMSLSAEQEKIRKELCLERREDEELRHRMLMTKSTLEQETRTVEELRRNIRVLQDEESDWKDRMSRSKAAFNQTKTSVEEAQNDAEIVRINNERERRDLAETRTKKNMVEAELSRCEEDLKYVQEQIRDEEKRKSSLVLAAQKSQDDASRWQKELLEVQRRCSEARKQEEDLRRRESEVQRVKDCIKAEADNLTAMVSAEQINMETIRNEKALLLSESKQAKEESRYYQKELTAAATALETSKAQLAHLDTVKENLQSEISRMRDSASLEIARAERVSESYKDVERRLRELRADLSREETAYERAKSRNADEENRYEQSRRAVHLAVEELSKIEASVAESNELIHSQRNKAIEEISHLGHIKQSVQHDVILLSDSKQRQERLHMYDSQHRANSTLSWAALNTSTTSKPPLSATENQYNIASSNLQQAISREEKGAPSISVFDSPARGQGEDSADVSREMDEAVFRSLQAAQQTSQNERDPFMFDSSPVKSRHDLEPAAESKHSQSSTTTRVGEASDSCSLRDEMQRLREKSAAILK